VPRITGLLAAPARVGFRLLPESWQRPIVRVATPGHTVGSLVVLRDGDRVLVVSQDHATGWCLPGGLLRRGETGRQGLRREVSEELGPEAWEAWAPSIGPLPSTALHDPLARRVDLVFSASVTGGQPVRLGPGVRRATWLPADAAMDNSTTAEVLRAIGAT
jgi:ADP-ribose pyrophosphatase YjhB (NUDIX family)